MVMYVMMAQPSPVVAAQMHIVCKFFHSRSSTCTQFQGLPKIELRWRNKQPQWSQKVLPKPLCEKNRIYNLSDSMEILLQIVK